MISTKPTKHFSSRFAQAKAWRQAEEVYLKEVLSYCCPGREKDFNRSATDKTATDSEVFTSIGEEVATDLASDLITYYTPSEVAWAEYQVMVPVPEDQVQAVMDLVEARESELNDILTASNYYDIAPAMAFEVCHGTLALWVAKAHLTQPIFFEVVPPHQLYIVPGHLGYLDRFREMKVMAETLPALFEGWEVDLSDQALQMAIKKPDVPVTVVWGFWIDWTDAGNPMWLCEITVNGKRITPETPMNLGPIAGSCPLLVGRFNPQTGRPWGRGPGRKALPDFRVLDSVDEVVLSGLDQSLTTTIIYPNDGVLDLSEGLEAGKAYPAGRGFRKEQVFDLSKSVNVDQGWFTEERLEERIRRAFYQDGPRQRGDTPPTAAQWVDERRRVQQRLGKPSAPLWTELFSPMIQRVEYLSVQSGAMERAITLNGQEINIKPISPLQKAQNQDKVMVSRSNLDMIFGFAGDQTGNVVDLLATAKNIIKTSGDELTVIKKEQTPPQGAPGEAAPPPA